MWEIIPLIGAICKRHIIAGEGGHSRPWREDRRIATGVLLSRPVSPLPTDLRQFLEPMVLAVAALLPIVNPLGGAPIFLAKTSDLTPDEHDDLARRVAVNCFVLLLVSTFIGAYVLDFFGLSIPAVQVAGGAVVCAMGWNLLNAPEQSPQAAKDAVRVATPTDLARRAFYPLSMPLTVGPGSI